MNFIPARSPTADLWDRYASLEPAPKLLLRLKSLIVLPVGKTDFLDCVTLTRVRSPDGKAWSARTVNAVLDDLLTEGLLTDKLACPPALLHPVAVDAVASEHAETLIAAVARTFPARHTTGPRRPCLPRAPTKSSRHRAPETDSCGVPARARGDR